MNINDLYPANTMLRAVLKSVVFVLLAAAAIFCAAAGYGLGKVLILAINADTQIGIAEFSTHIATMHLFMALAGLGAYAAKKAI